MARVKIILHGYLKNLYSDEVVMEGTDVAEIINGFCKQTKAFNTTATEERHQIRVHGFDSEASLFAPLSDEITELHLMPAMCGGKGGGFIKIFIGTVLIVAAFIIGGPEASVAMAKFVTALYAAGISLIAGGLLELISPAPQMDSSPAALDVEASKYLGANQNTVKIGTRIPILYGKHRMYGHFLSFNVDARDVSL